MRRSYWGTRLGFYLAAIGSAFGLGSLWRFPYVVAENGGAAFILLYAALVFLIGLPLIVGELLIGKLSRQSLVPAARQTQGDRPGGAFRPPSGEPLDRWLSKAVTHASRLSLFLCLVVLSYYAVVSGWVLYFFMKYLMAWPGLIAMESSEALNLLKSKGWLQVLLASVHLLVVIVVVARDVEEGIERWVGYMMPLFVVLLLALIAKSLTLETNTVALRFLLYPDFSKLTLSSLGHAVGHVFFALSLGFGTMVTFGSYLRKESSIPIAGFRVATLDSFISIFACLLIFPLVFSISEQVDGPEMLFKTVPTFFAQIPGGDWLGLAFFLCLYLASLGASIGLLETVVANLNDCYRIPRPKAAWMMGLICFIVALFPALSSTALSEVTYRGRGFLELLDAALINWILPLLGLVVSLLVSYWMSDKVRRQEFVDAQSPVSARLYSHWRFALKWIVPAVIIVSLSLQAVHLFRN